MRVFWIALPLNFYKETVLLGRQSLYSVDYSHKHILAKWILAIKKEYKHLFEYLMHFFDVVYTFQKCKVPKVIKLINIVREFEFHSRKSY